MKLSLTLLASLTAVFDVVLGASFTNPLREENGSDPFIVTSDGYYYLLTTTWTDIQVTRATTLEGLKTGETKVVYKDSDPSRCCSVWAPEVHFLEGKWWIYYTAGTADTLDNQKMHVLEGGATPFDEYTYSAQLFDEWSIDGSIMRMPDANYLTYSCQREGRQSICMALLESPSKVGPPALLNVPTEEWEIQGEFPVAEGPVGLYHGGETYLVYTGSNCWTASYQLGYLRYDGSGDPLDQASWSKTGPVFSSANGNYGTGHNAFFTSLDGEEIWNVYHATAVPEGACDGRRYTAVNKVEWNADGTPDFGEATKVGVELDGPSGE